MIRGLDTNVLVRYLTQDEPGEARKANAVIEGTLAKGGSCYLSIVVLCEIVWVLRGAYRLGKKSILLALDRILETEGFRVEDQDLVREALEEFRLGRGDFADYAIGARNRAAGCEDTVTFDRSLKGSGLFAVI
ncbi:MAG TPA: type II toxin-antitoxin system VapC family toxin [Thermoanaerobaculia bacterium]